MSTNPKLFSSRSCYFSPKNKILIYSIVYRFMHKSSTFHGKTARYDVSKLKFVDISHPRYKLCTVEISSSSPWSKATSSGKISTLLGVG
jgi:hypothetical protein